MDELAALWTACGDPRVRPAFGAYVRALIVLGSRQSRDRHGAAFMDQARDGAKAGAAS